MLELTSSHNKIYCDINGINYEKFVGVYRGYWPWQATFNRIIKLKALVDAGYKGWFLYVDADSYIFDLSFDIKSYLKSHSDCFFIAATGGDGRRLAVNAGVFFLDLSRSESVWLVNRWHELFLMRAPDTYLRKQSSWENDGVNDQEFLHQTLGERQKEFDPIVWVDDGTLLNYRGAFIRQILRTTFRELHERMDAIGRDIALSRCNYGFKD